MYDSGPAAALWERLSKYEGVPKWWSEVLANVGLSPLEAEAFVCTARVDKLSPLSVQSDADLNATLRGYAEARGIRLVGTGVDDVPARKSWKKTACRVSTVATAAEQAYILDEVSDYAEVVFTERVNGVYTDHAVANGVRTVHQVYGRKLAPKGARVLELGASVKTMVGMGVDPATNHGCCPVLDVRDGVRHSIDSYLHHVLSPESGYTDRKREAARAALDPDSGYFCRLRAQECSWKADFIFSNESTHDVPFQDLPLIMARHGARTWVGFMARPVGYKRGAAIKRGGCATTNVRWQVDETRDLISFHFARGASFSYTHKFSEWIKYEDNVEYRWRGRYFDYVYARLPITTQSSLAFVVSRVPKSEFLLENPVYLPTGMDGLVKIHSLKVVGGCIGVRHPKFEPFSFCMERLAFDKVFEHRMTLGSRGNLAATIAYMRSVRVRMFVNGVAMGAVTVVPSEILESAAVAVEALAFDSRERMESDYGFIMRQSAVSRGVLTKLWEYFRSCSSGLPDVSESLRAAIVALAEPAKGVRIGVEPCGTFMRNDDAIGGEFRDETVLEAASCGCGDYTDVMAALQVADCLGDTEREELEAFRDELAPRVAACCLHNGINPEEMSEEFFDASEGVSAGTPSEFSDSGLGSSADASDAEGEHVVAESLREYAAWAGHVERAARSEAEKFAAVLFYSGNPSEEEVKRASVARTRHAVVAVVDEVIVGSVGAMAPDEEYSEIFCPRTKRFFSVKGTAKRYAEGAATGLYYTGSMLCVLNGERLARGVHRVMMDLPENFAFPRYAFVNGVPGCGKTTEIVARMRELTAAGKCVMYLTATKESAGHVRSELAGLSLGDRMVNHFDSHLCNLASFRQPSAGVDVLFLDEVPMMHAGAVYAAMLSVMARDVKMYGDFEQIPFQSFTVQMPIRWASLRRDVDVEYRSVTHRFGASTCAMWLDVYGEIYPCDCCAHVDETPEVVRTVGAEAVPREDVGRYLTFTQEEKSNLKRELRLDGGMAELRRRTVMGLSTAAESQGGTFDTVAIVRTINKKNPKESEHSPSIYNRQPWVLVATTRHRTRLVYYTAADSDMVSSRIALARCAVRVEAARNKVPWKEIAHKAMRAPRFGSWG